MVKKRIFVDIDGTICTWERDGSYEEAKPYLERIKKINALYEEGNIITYWTARGSGSGIDWSFITKKQLNEWGVKYHKLFFGKPVYDVFIDDKAINSENFFVE